LRRKRGACFRHRGRRRRSRWRWTSNDLDPRVLADLNHDGAADIVGFGHDGVYTLAHQFDLA
jgi:hypothetical protein